ncbi:MAG TPA: (Fe-S)-binding protein [Bacillota bacterium]|jgi:Fe-S oxidoreductase|nr:(Fe-S)-binding protein [Bacillota bacterium]HOL02797.1 (Fe-S)-binding protein [Bacillota bacterium]HPU61751.1 (Fe-S)-binding protein [Bacillota bacterium]
MSDMKSWTTIDVIKACRFCWMCRHVCTVGSMTAYETDTPRGKMLSLYGKLMEMDIPDSEISQTMYKCCLCYRCLEECVGGFDVPEVVLNTRAELVEEGEYPKSLDGVRRLLSETGVIDGRGCKVSKEDVESIVGRLPDKAPVVLFAGSSTVTYTPQAVLGAAKILKSAGIDFTMLDHPASSAYEFYEMGFRTDAVRVASETAGALNQICDSSSERPVVITLDPSDNWALTSLYQQWGIETSFDAIDFSSYVHNLLKTGRLNLGHADVVVTYHDPCHLGRVQRVFTQPREVLKSIEGLSLEEMHWNSQQAHCCGGHLKSTDPTLAAQIARKRVDQIKETGVGKVVTACPKCCDSLNSPDDDIEVIHIAEFLANYLK